MNQLPRSNKAIFASVGLAAALCSAAFAQDPPLNNECAGAETIVPGVAAPFDTTNATGSPEAVGDEGPCGGGGFNWGDPLTNPDVWFKWTATADGLINATTCSPGSFDTSLIMYSGSCANLTRVACNGDAPDSETTIACQQWYSLIEYIPVTAGTTYYFRVGGWGGDKGVGALTITVNPPYVYQCQAPAAANDCATGATVVTASGPQSVDTTGYNTDGPPLTGGLCGNDVYNDVWFRVSPTQAGTLVVSTCGTTTLDTRIAIYDMGSNPGSFNYNNLITSQVGCADGGCPGVDQLQATASIVTYPGKHLLVRVGGATEFEEGAFVVNFTMPTPCPLANATILEEEPCGQNLNGGCNSDPAFPPVQEIAATGGTIGGTFWADASIRDTDWYQFTLTSDRLATFVLSSTRSGAVMSLVGPTCPTGAALAQGFIADGTCSVTMSACLRAGTYRLVVAPPFADTPCGTQLADYRVDMTSQSAQCDSILITGSCATPGSVTVLGCATATAANSYSIGSLGSSPGCVNFPGSSCVAPIGAPKVWWAAPYANPPKQVNCVQMGVAPLRSWDPPGDTDPCNVYYSNLRLSYKVGFYRDINGGTPTNFVGQPNGDLELIASYRAETPIGSAGGGFLYVNLPEPLCLEGYSNIVLVAEVPNFFNGTLEDTYGVPAGAGFAAGVLLSSRPAGSPPSNTFLKHTCTGSAANGQFTRWWSTNVIEWYNAMIGEGVCTSEPCPADLNDDGIVNGDDLGVLLTAWGACASSECPADLSDDGVVNGDDLGLLLTAWGACP